MSLKKIAPRRKRMFPTWWSSRSDIVQLPRRKKQAKMLIAISEGRSSGIHWREAGRVFAGLVDMGLLKVGRTRRMYSGCARNTVKVTDEGERAVWDGELPIEKPTAKTARKKHHGRGSRRGGSRG